MVRSNKKKLSRKRITHKSKKPHKLTKKQTTRLKQPKKTKTRKTKRKTRKLKRKRKSRKLKGGIDFNTPFSSTTRHNPLFVSTDDHHKYIKNLKKFPELIQKNHPYNKKKVYFYVEHNNKIYLFEFLYDNNDRQANLLDKDRISLIILKDNTKNEEEQYVYEDMEILTKYSLGDGDFFNELNKFINENLKNKKPREFTNELKNKLLTILTNNILIY
jgi:hypothetical protein